MKNQKFILTLTFILLLIVFVIAILYPKENVVILDNGETRPDRNYIGYTEEECSRIQVLCTPDREYFSDETGCGCELKQPAQEERFNCTEESRTADFCIEIYQPVCGWNDPEKIRCIKFPCASTSSNSCFACQDENVLYYTEGVCPK